MKQKKENKNKLNILKLAIHMFFCILIGILFLASIIIMISGDLVTGMWYIFVGMGCVIVDIGIKVCIFEGIGR